MRRALFLPTVLLLALCGRSSVGGESATSAPALADVEPSVVFGPAGALEGGDVTVGILVPRAPAARLLDRVPQEIYQAFLEDEAAHPEETGAPEEIVEGYPGLPTDAEMREAAARADALRATAEALAGRTHVRFHFQYVLATELANLPLLLVEGSVPSGPDEVPVRRYLQEGGEVLADRPEGGVDLGEARPGVLPVSKDDVAVLVDACEGLLRTSGRVRRLPHDPLAVKEAVREGDRVRVVLAAAPAEATLRNVAGDTVAPADVCEEGTVLVDAPDPAVDPYAHRLVCVWKGDGLVLRRAWRIVDLVGALERRVYAAPVAEAGTSYAPHVLFSYGDGHGPAAGVEETLALVKDGRVLSSATGRTNESGNLGLALPVPEDAQPGRAALRIGTDEYVLQIRSGLRVHVTTDRPLYRPTDEVHARVLVHRAGNGAPVAGQEVILRLFDAEKRVKTSAHGIASASFSLVEAKPGDARLKASARDADDEATILVRAFETPAFSVSTDPAEVSLHPGEATVLRVTARYTNDQPVSGAHVEASPTGKLNARGATGSTDGRGECALTLRLTPGSRSGTFLVRVTDRDGRWIDQAVPVHVVRDDVAPVARLVALDDGVVGLPCRVRVESSKPGSVTVLLPGGEPKVVEVGESGESEPFTIVPSSHQATLELRTADGTERPSSFAALRWDGKTPLLLLRRKTARVGETLTLRVRGADGPVQLDVGRDGTLVRAFGVVVRDGEARLDMPLADDLAGLLELRAWRIEGTGDAERVAGTRVRVLVTRGRALRVSASTQREAYRPGQTAEVGVQVTDAAGRPVGGPGAVLGYWGVDEALLQLRPFGAPLEEVFDVLPQHASSSAGAVALDVEHGRDVALAGRHEALGNVGDMTGGAEIFGIAERSSRVHEKAARDAARKAAADAFVALRSAWGEALGRTPLEEAPVTASLREETTWLLRREWLSPSALLDPWGTPFRLDFRVVRRRNEEMRRSLGASWWEEAGIPCHSAGPDLRFGTADDVELLWVPFFLVDVPGRLGRFLRFVWSHRTDVSGWGDGLSDAPFTGPVTNGLIGLGGGAGGAFAGRGGRKDLGGTGGGARLERPPVRLRRDFDPTLCFVPESPLGPDGRTTLEIPLKDSITTWRLRLVASDRSGATGVGEGRIRVTQPLHAEPWVAPHLTVGDALDLPVAIRCEAEEALHVTLRLGLSKEIECLGERRATVEVPAGGTTAHTFRIHAVLPGEAKVRIDAEGGGYADAVLRVIDVSPDAYPLDQTENAGLGADVPFSPALPALAASIPRDRRITVYPTPLAETLGGLEGLLACPHG